MCAVRLEAEGLALGRGLAVDLLTAEAGAPARDLFPPRTFEVSETQGSGLRAGAAALPETAFHCTGREASDRLRAALAGDGLLVTTGQQPQLFGGPLYVVYKALTAIRTAFELETSLGVPCLAAFWVASDDHDWNEVASVTFLDAADQLRRVQLEPPPGWEARSVGRAPLPPTTAEFVNAFCAQLASHADGEPWHSRLRDIYVPGRTFADAFIDLLSTWLGELPLALLDSTQPTVMEAGMPLVRGVVERADAVDRALRAGAQRVEQAGYRTQLTYLDGALPLFRDDGSGRRRLDRSRAGFQTAGRGPEISAEDLVADLEERPSFYSPAAALRPILESYLLPVAATVLGPGEMAYWAQLSPLFTALDVPMPRIRPRDSWRVIEPRIDRLLGKLGLAAADFSDGGVDAASALVERSRPAAVEEALRHLEERAEADFTALERATDSEMPGIRPSVGKARAQVSSALEAFRRAMDGRTRDLQETQLAQLHRVAHNLYPEGVPQERALSPFTYLTRYGDSFLADVRRAGTDGTDE